MAIGFDTAGVLFSSPSYTFDGNTLVVSTATDLRVFTGPTTGRWVPAPTQGRWTLAQVGGRWSVSSNTGRWALSSITGRWVFQGLAP